MAVILAVIILLVSVYFISKYPSYKKRKQLLDAVPSPPSRFLVGHGLEIRSPTDVHSKLYEWTKKYGSVFRISIGPMTQYIVSDPEVLEFITTSNTLISKPRLYKFAEPWLGKGLLTSTGSKWRKRRKAITPSFHFKILEQFVEIVDNNAYALVEKLRSAAESSSSIEVFSYMSLCTLDSICETAMGIKLGAQEKSDSDYVKAVHFLTRNLLERNYSVIKYFDFTYAFTSNCKEEQRSLKIVHGFSEEVIKRRRREKQVSEPSENKENTFGIKKKMAFLDMLLQAEIDEKPLTDSDIREEVDTFIFEGHDTTTSAISFILYCLSKHPDVQAKAYQELERILGGDKRKVLTYSDLQEMKYLEVVIKESLRVYPAVPLVARKITEDFQCGGYTFLKDCDVVLLIYGLHMNPKNFKDPEIFDPDRWLEEDQQRHLFSYLPFSAGPRNCIGQKYAIMTVKTIVSKILMNYELGQPESPKELILSSQAILKSKNGVHITIKYRN